MHRLKRSIGDRYHDVVEGSVRPCVLCTVPRAGIRTLIELFVDHPEIEFACNYRRIYEDSIDLAGDTTALVCGHVPWEHMLDIPAGGADYRLAAAMREMLRGPFVTTLRCPLRTTLTQRYAEAPLEPMCGVMGFVALSREIHRDDVVAIPIDTPMRDERIADALRLWGLAVDADFMSLAAARRRRRLGTLQRLKGLRRAVGHYEACDMEWLHTHYAGELVQLQRHEHELRPMFEAAGYDKLPWYS